VGCARRLCPEQIMDTLIRRVRALGGVELNKQLVSLKIDPEVVSKDDVEMLQDLILAAINDAYRKVDQELEQQLGGMMGGMKIPGMF
jgi:DNA-binding protein YbaB